jgi:hypothetical protein
MQETDLYQRSESLTFIRLLEQIMSTDILSQNNLATINTTDFTVIENGEAFISQTKIAELTGIPQQTISGWVRRDSVAYNTNKFNQLDAKSFQKLVILGSPKYPKCLQFMGMLVEAGARAFIYTQAGYSITAQKPKTQLEMLAEGFAKMAEIEKEQAILHLKVDRIEATLDDIQVSHQFFTVTAYIKLNRLPSMNVRECAKIGRTASKLCKESGIKLGTVPDGRWGSVNQYPHHVLDEVFLNQ